MKLASRDLSLGMDESFPDDKQARIDKLIGVLCPLIKSKTQIVIWYVDETDESKADWRHLEPHLIGIHKDSHEYLLSAFFRASQVQQISGKYTSRWGTYLLDRIDIHKIEVLDAKYLYTRRGYNFEDSHMSKVLCFTTPYPDPHHQV